MIKSKKAIYEIVMESSQQKPSSVRAKIIVPDDVEVPSFDFENMLIEHYKRYPRTAALVEKPIYLEALMNPFKMFYLVPIALFKLKLNTILSLKWKEFLKLWIYIALLYIPTLFFVMLPFQTKSRLMLDIAFNVGTPILIAILLSLFYLKYTHDGFLSLTQAKRVEWLEKPVREYYTKYYDRYIPKNPLIILASFATGIGIQIPMLRVAFVNNNPVAAAFGIVTCILSPFLYYIFFVAVYFMFFNTRIYSKILKPIKEKMDVYRKEYGTLLMRENYDIIWSLGDKWSKGRSISQLENIPTAGIVSTLIIIIAMVMGNVNQLVYSIPTPPGMPTHNVNFLFLQAGQPATILVVTISALIAVLMVLYVFLPLWFFSIKAKKFKIKALMELDNYIFANVVEFGEKYSEEAKREHVTMLQLREYVASMRIFPISTQQLFRTVVAIAIWVINILKIIRSVGGGI